MNDVVSCVSFYIQLRLMEVSVCSVLRATRSLSSPLSAIHIGETEASKLLEFDATEKKREEFSCFHIHYS